MPNVTWNNVKSVISQAVDNGVTTLIGKGQKGEMIYEALLQIKDETVRVTYSITDGVAKLGDAWVVKK